MSLGILPYYARKRDVTRMAVSLDFRNAQDTEVPRGPYINIFIWNKNIDYNLSVKTS